MMRTVPFLGDYTIFVTYVLLKKNYSGTDTFFITGNSKSAEVDPYNVSDITNNLV